MLSDALKGKTIADAKRIASIFRNLMQGAPPPEDQLIEIGDMNTLAGVRKFPVRIKCTLLSLSALEDALDEYDREG